MGNVFWEMTKSLLQLLFLVVHKKWNKLHIGMCNIVIVGVTAIYLASQSTQI